MDQGALPRLHLESHHAASQSALVFEAWRRAQRRWAGAREFACIYSAPLDTKGEKPARAASPGWVARFVPAF
jgi:hypothetical protein